MRQRLRIRRSDDRRMVMLNVVPLIDVVFFLLVFYVISTSFGQDQGVDVHRPQAAASPMLSPPYVTVAVLPDGGMSVGGRRIDAQDAQGALAEALVRSGSSQVLVEADRDLPVGTLVKVMDLCRTAGARSMSLATAREVR